MKPYQASLFNAIILISLGVWAYFSSATPSFTALIPVAIGVILLFLNKGIKTENKTIAHIAVLLTVLVLGGLVKPLLGAIGRSDVLAISRVVVMILSTLLAVYTFVMSFINARKARK